MKRDPGAPLAPLTTLGIGGPARTLLRVEGEDDLVEALREVERAGDPLLVLGGGSNVVLADEGFEGTVIQLANRGVETFAHGAEAVVDAAAGEPWDDLVTLCVDDGMSGVECLAGIPGLVGATPIQNVGAYGQEVSESIVSVRAYDRVERRFVELAGHACGFAYRHSMFKRSGRWIIVSVKLALRLREPAKPVRYAELSRALGVAEGERAPLRAVRDTVVALRREKGMVVDPSDPDTAGVGSFFTNPIVDAALADAAEARAGGGAMPRFPADGGRVKLAAGWLIERAGFAKGWAKGRAAISGKHALAITNRGGATAVEILALAREVRDRVKERFGVTLEPEPVIMGPRGVAPADW
jgi:UDP-N-acetylmuramate dehydrogenase